MSPSRRNFLKITTVGGIASSVASSILGFDLTLAHAQTETKQGGNMKSQSSETKPSIVFCHGIWADGSCFSKVIPALQAEGHQCIAAQYALNTTADDVATVKQALGRVSSPAILVGHSYGGSVNRCRNRRSRCRAGLPRRICTGRR